MLEFFSTDVGKVALGGAIAVGGQLTVTLMAWTKEALFAADKRRKEAEYLAMRVVLTLDELVGGCYNAVCDPLREDEEGASHTTTPNPTLTLPADGDYKALPRSVMYELLSMPNRLSGIKEGLSSVGEESFPPDYEEYFEYRRLNWSKFGLQALSLIDTLCREYKIPVPERPDYYTPSESFKAEIAEIERRKRERDERTQSLMVQMSAAHGAVPVAAQLHRDGKVQT
ncbi:hypothetical protein [Tardiphaga sp. 619_E2_N8_5]|uniref:hypothetical protein n=1 Tax=unclassified Tardiphaga TaxID=2631404 RepID=UPI003F2934BC